MNQPSEKDLQDVQRHVRQHVMIAVGIAVGTIMTVWTSQTNFGQPWLNTTLTLLIASVQAFFVAGFFMHLLSEKKMIYAFLIFTAIFVVVLMGVDFFAHMPSNVVQYRAEDAVHQ